MQDLRLFTLKARLSEAHVVRRHGFCSIFAQTPSQPRSPECSSLLCDLRVWGSRGRVRQNAEEETQCEIDILYESNEENVVVEISVSEQLANGDLRLIGGTWLTVQPGASSCKTYVLESSGHSPVGNLKIEISTSSVRREINSDALFCVARSKQILECSSQCMSMRALRSAQLSSLKPPKNMLSPKLSDDDD